MNSNLKRISRKLALLLMVTMLAAGVLFSASVSAEDSVNLALDVIFVIDGSGSMSITDPNRIAMAACNLFSDMCDYEQARAGYVVYADQIAQTYPLLPLNPESSRQAFKSSIDSIRYPSVTPGTDISLGLTKGMNMLIEGGALSDGRSPMIILFSDGRTEYISQSRQAIYDEELKDTLAFLEQNGIPVYTVAICNANTNTDEETMQSIAESTNALYFSTESANNLSNILSQIMADRLRSNMDVVEELVGNGQAQTVEVEIPNDSIYQANIIAFSGSGVTNIHLHEPTGNEVVVPSSKVLLSRSTSYDLIKIIRPSKGTWKLTLTGADQDHISINLIKCYDMQFKLNADKYTVGNGDSVSFDVYCDSLIDGESDSTILDGAEGTLTITDTVTGGSREVNLSWNGTELGASYTFTKAGTYAVTGRIIGKDSSYDRTTDEIKITVNPYPLALVQGTSETSGWCFSPFLGIKINNTLEVPLVNLLSWDADAVLTVTPTPGGWENICDFSYDEANTVVTFSGIGGGNAVIDLKIADSFGQSVSYTVRVKVIPGWLPVVLVLLLAAIIVAVILIIKRAKAPYIKGKLKISLNLPNDLAAMTPPEAEIDLSVLNKKGKVSMNAVIASNLNYSGSYMQALEGISGFIQKLSVEAANADCSALYLHIPAPESGVNIQFNNAPIDKKTKKSINAGMPAILNHASLNGSYGITFNFSDGAWGANGDIFGGGGGGFGGFGGGGGNNPFGGGSGSPFGGDSGFGGSPFGGNDSSFGGSPFGGNGGNTSAGNNPFGGGTNDGGFGGGNNAGGSPFGGNGGNTNAGGSPFGGTNDGGFGGNNTNNGGFGGFGNDNGNSFNAF